MGVEGSSAVFALPNAAHRDAAEERRAVVEQALSSHFGTPIALRLTVDDASAARAPGAPEPRPDGARTTGRPDAPDPDVAPEPDLDDGLDPDDEIDPNQPSGSAEDAAQARLLQAFPGAEEVG
jgi:hypothetical protein